MAAQERTHVRTTRSKGRWKHGPIPVIGLTGAIGAGKSVVASMLAERGAFVLDADAVGHALLTQRPVREQVVKRFGTGILEHTAGPEGPGVIDRRNLGALVFADSGSRRALESIVHPRMRRTFERAIARTVRKGQAAAIVLDAAILLEAGWADLCDCVLFVDAPHTERLARLQGQRGWEGPDLEAREAAQWPLEKKHQLADAVIANDSDLGSLRKSVEEFWAREVARRPRAPFDQRGRKGRSPRPAGSHAQPPGKPPNPRRGP